MQPRNPLVNELVPYSEETTPETDLINLNFLPASAGKKIVQAVSLAAAGNKGKLSCVAIRAPAPNVMVVNLVFQVPRGVRVNAESLVPDSEAVRDAIRSAVGLALPRDCYLKGKLQSIYVKVPTPEVCVVELEYVQEYEYVEATPPLPQTPSPTRTPRSLSPAPAPAPVASVHETPFPPNTPQAPNVPRPPPPRPPPPSPLIVTNEPTAAPTPYYPLY